MSGLITKEVGPLKLKFIGPILLLENEMNFWSWSPYDKCSFRCVFCSVEAQGKSKPQVTAEEIPAILDEFAEYSNNEYPLALGSCTDCYPIEEKEYGLTRITLQELSKRNIRTVVTTHGDMVARDIDILKDMTSLDAIGMSIPHYDNERLKFLEPGAPTFEARVEAVWKLYDAGLPIHVNVSPFIPGISEPDKVARELPEDMLVNVGVLSYNEHQNDITKHLFGRDIPSSKRVFGKDFADQAAINEKFHAAHEATRGGTKGNLKWLIPPGSGKNYTNYLPD